VPAVPDPLNEEESDTHFKFFFLPGAHNTGAMRLKSEVALIVAYLAHKFLSKHGTSISEKISLTPRDLCELYARDPASTSRSTARRRAAACSASCWGTKRAGCSTIRSARPPTS